ncbi:expressed protein [Chlorella variabilis]|uniref:Expressed protein n=1 Tax=Chlorella variabilis TaxID=554065 RepID=E1ZHF4_CHLVA|nr:expressed protein [Chlorella variabilis]EFN55114.1 expressed protein [Chlorella variabilis]|eukprot:XP_005847216.1 expressed protein [Chlorella variabilis]
MHASSRLGMGMPSRPPEGALSKDDCDVSSRPVYSCVVKFKVRASEGEAKLQDEEVRLARKFINRAYLLMLSSQDVRLYATRSDDFMRSSESGLSDPAAKPDAGLPAFIAKSITWLPPMTTMAVEASVVHGRKLVKLMSMSSRIKAPPPAEAAPPSGVAFEEELPQGALATLGVALSQIVDVRQAGAAVNVAFRRQHPSTRFMDKAERLLLMPWAINRGKQTDPDHDPMVRSCVLSVVDEAAAAELVGELQAARQRLAAAVQWIARGLPLNDAPAPTLVTVQPAGAGGGASAAPAAAGAEVLATAPTWGSNIAVPARWVQQAAHGAPGSSPVLVVWLFMPLGPATASLSMQKLMEGFREGTALVVAEAQPLHRQGDGAAEVAAGWEGPLRVQLQACMQQGEQDTEGEGAAGGAAPQVSPEVTEAAAQPHLPMVWAVVAAVLAAWLQLFAISTAARWAAFLVCNLAAALVVRRMQADRLASKRPQATAEEGGWTLTLLQASLVAAAEVQQVASEAGVVGRRKGERRGAAEDQLPQSFRQLVGKHPDVLDDNMAQRFLVGYSSPNKAYVALQQCVFEQIKHRYPHAVLGWSKKKDCLVTLDSYGVWKQSYDALRADGVTEDQLLRHLMLCFDFYFKVLDSRPLPQGKSVNIIDLSGLKMSDAAGEAFRFISKAGALLNLHYPLRLHKAFLINAPSWWSVVWRMVSPLIDKNTRELMSLFSIKDADGAARAMLEWIDADVLPNEYGGESTAGLYDCELEQRFWQHVSSRNSGQQGIPSEPPGASAAPVSAPATPEL